MHFYKYIGIISLLFMTNVSLAKCLPEKNISVDCRYEKGDSWCKENDSENPYAFSDSCLSEDDKATSEGAADISGLKELRQNMRYSKARNIILGAGWQGSNTRWQEISEFGQENDIYHKNGWREVKGCAGTGTAPCRFEFHDIYNNVLEVITEGECSDEEKCDPTVSSWNLDSIDKAAPESKKVDNISLKENNLNNIEEIESFCSSKNNLVAKFKVNVKTVLNVRKLTSTKSDIITKLDPNKIINVLNDCSKKTVVANKYGRWLKVSSGGYIFSTFLTEIEGTRISPAVQSIQKNTTPKKSLQKAKVVTKKKNKAREEKKSENPLFHFIQRSFKNKSEQELKTDPETLKLAQRAINYMECEVGLYSVSYLYEKRFLMQNFNENMRISEEMKNPKGEYLQGLENLVDEIYKPLTKDNLSSKFNKCQKLLYLKKQQVNAFGRTIN